MQSQNFNHWSRAVMRCADLMDFLEESLMYTLHNDRKMAFDDFIRVDF